MGLRAVAFAAVALSLSTAAAGEQYDLVCRGTVSAPKDDPFTRTFRLDLDRRLFCQGNCARVLPIQVTGPPTLLFKDFDPKAGAVHQVDILDGSYRSYNSRGSAKGRCVRRPFSGFPASRRK